MATTLSRLLLATLIIANASAASAEVCLSIDEARDTFAPRDREGAILLLTTQFEVEGERVVPGACPNPFVLFHAQLGNLIVVTISGKGMTWQATAMTDDDLPAIYSQMAKSIVTGRPMTGLSVVDRTNVTSSQADARRVHSDTLWYGRLGYGGAFSDRVYDSAAIGFGFRAELDAFAIDVAFLNHQFSSGGYSSPGASVSSWLKLSGLRFLSPRGNRSAYVGGGLSYGQGTISRGGYSFTAGPYTTGVSQYTTDWSGRGLQGELSAGYEFARATSLRVFVQADAVLPFYRVTSETRSASGLIASDSRYLPSLVLSVGVGR